MRSRATLIGVVAMFFLAAAAADRLVARVVDGSRVAAEAVDITSPEVYLAKLSLIRRHKGRSVVVIGDSQIVGETMGQHGDPSWHDHTLDRALESRLERDPSFSDVLVVNLGINGLLPTDLEFMARDALDAGASALVFNVSIRSFSADFNTAQSASARPWMAKLCRERGQVKPCGALERLFNESFLYQSVDLLQQRFLGGPMRDAVVNGADEAFKRWLRPADADEENAEGDLVLMIRARSRFDTVSFDQHGLQVGALRRTLDEIRAREAKAVVFYTTENHAQFDQIMDPAHAGQVRNQVLAFLNGYASPSLQVVPPLENVAAEHFLDFMHLDAQGYQILAERLTPLVAGLLGASSALSPARTF